MMECVVTESPKESQTVGSSNLDILKNYHKETFKFINEGLNLEDQGKTKEAVLCYKKGLRSIEGAIKLPNGPTELNAEEKKECEKIISKLNRAKTEVTLRLDVLEEPQKIIPSVSEPPRQITPSAPPQVIINNDVRENVNEGVRSNGDVSLAASSTDTWQDVKELLSIEEGVRLFHVDGKGEVSTWTSPCTLNIFQILKEHLEQVSPAAFMKCGEWIYPMEPGQSPVLESKNRTYMFPDISMEQSSDLSQIPCVGVVLSDIVPDTVAKRFERILSCYCDFRKEVEHKIKEKPKRPPPPSLKAGERVKPKDGVVAEADVIIATSGVAVVEESSTSWSDKVSTGINVGSQWISWGFLKGAQYASVLVEKGATSLKQRISPNAEATVMDPEISRNIRQLHQATGSVVQVSGFLVSALGTLTVNLGKKLAPHVEYHGKKLLPDKYKTENNESSQKKVEEIKQVAAASLQGFGIMFLALEQAGKNLYKSVSVATVQTMQHKYGDEVGDVTENTMGAVGNTVQAYWNVQKLGPKAIAKRAVKDTGKAMILDEKTKQLKSLEQ